MRVIGRSIYEVCGTCGSIIRLNKPIIGSLHICLSEEDMRTIRANPQQCQRLQQHIAQQTRAFERSSC
jgi:hypothetical protein